MRIVKPQEDRKENYDALGNLFERLRRGVFPASCDKDPCGICEYASICGGEGIAVPRSRRKLQADEKMAPFRKVMDHA